MRKQQETREAGAHGSYSQKVNFREFIGYIMIIVACITTIYGFIAWIDNRIQSTICRQEFLARIAAQVRPSAIFDNNGSILADMGAMRIIDSISVLQTNVLIVTVNPKQFLCVAPIITCLDKPHMLSNVERGKMFAWIYTFKFIGYIDVTGSINSDPSALLMTGCSVSDRYRIEILQPAEH